MSVDSLILEAAEEAQALLDAFYRQTPEPAAGSVLDQAGLRNGLSIVRDKIRQVGEALGLPESAYAGVCR